MDNAPRPGQTFGVKLPLRVGVVAKYSEQAVRLPVERALERRTRAWLGQDPEQSMF